MTSKESHMNLDSCIATHTNHLLKFKLAFYLVPWLLHFEIITVKRKPNPVLNALLCTRPLTFIIETLRLVGAAW